MTTLDARSQQQIIELLSPLMASEQDRRSRLIFAFGSNHPLEQQIEYSGSVAAFMPNLVNSLIQFGKLDNGRPALWVLLEAAREQVGLDQKHRIDALRPVFELPPPPRLDRIFVSYSRKNERDAQRIVSDLKDAGLRVWFDREKIKVGDDWWDSIIRGISNADYFLFCLSPDSIHSKTARDELLTARRQGKTVFAVMLENCLEELAKEDFAEISWLPKLHIIDFTQAMQAEAYGTQFRELIQSLPGYTPPDTYFIDEYEPRNLPNPFRGLEAFLEVDASYFFGREDIIQDLLTRLRDPQRPRLLAVVGASGSGKSSLIRAGLIPAMRQAFPSWETLTIKPGSNPINDLADRLQERLGIQAERTRERLRESRTTLDDITTELLTRKPDDARFVLIIDQFEELFTLTSDDERRTILDLLLYAIQHNGGRSQVILTMRADFFDRLSAVPDLANLVRDNVYISTDMTPEQLRRSIELPAKKVGVTYETGLVETILEDVRSQPGSLPLLQYALRELFERKLGRQLRSETYESIGGVKGALATRAELVFQSLSEAQQHILRRVFLRLVEVNAETTARRRVNRSDLKLAGVNDNDIQAVLDRLTDSETRLLIASTASDPVSSKVLETQYEVSHEAILTHWIRLNDWIEQYRSDLQLDSEILHSARAWDAVGRSDRSLLLQGQRLRVAIDWMKRGDPTEFQKEYILISKTAVRQRSTRLIGISIVILVAIAAISAVAITQFNQRYQAQVVQSSLSMLNDAEARLEDGDFAYALSLVMEANNFDSPPSRAQLILADFAQSPGILNTIEGSVDHQDFAFSPTGDLMYVAASHGGLMEWNWRTGEQVRLFASDQANIIFSEIEITPDGRQIIAGSGGQYRGVSVWDIDTGRHTRHVADFTASKMRISRDGRLLAVVGFSGSVLVYSLQDWSLLFELPAHTSGWVYDVGFTPDGQYLVTTGSDYQVILWSMETGERTSGFRVRHVPVVFEIEPNGQYLVGGFNGGLVRIDLFTGEVIREDTLGYSVNAVEISADGQHVLVAGGVLNVDGTLFEVRGLDSGEQLWQSRVQGYLWHGAFATDERYVVLGQNDGLMVWDTHPGNRHPINRILDSGEPPLLAVSPSETRFAASLNGSVYVSALVQGDDVTELNTGDIQVTEMRFAGEDRLVLLDDARAEFVIWDINQNRSVDTVALDSADDISVWTVSPDGTLIAVSYQPDARIMLHGLGDGSQREFADRSFSNVSVIVFENNNSSFHYLTENGLWGSYALLTEQSEADIRYLPNQNSLDVISSDFGWAMSATVTSTPSALSSLTFMDRDGNTVVFNVDGITTVGVSEDGRFAFGLTHEYEIIVADRLTKSITRRFELTQPATVVFLSHSRALIGFADGHIEVIELFASREELGQWIRENRVFSNLPCTTLVFYNVPRACDDLSQFVRAPESSTLMPLPTATFPSFGTDTPQPTITATPSVTPAATIALTAMSQELIDMELPYPVRVLDIEGMFPQFVTSGFSEDEYTDPMMRAITSPGEFYTNVFYEAIDDENVDVVQITSESPFLNLSDWLNSLGVVRMAFQIFNTPNGLSYATIDSDLLGGGIEETRLYVLVDDTGFVTFMVDNEITDAQIIAAIDAQFTAEITVSAPTAPPFPTLDPTAIAEAQIEFDIDLNELTFVPYIPTKINQFELFDVQIGQVSDPSMEAILNAFLTTEGAFLVLGYTNAENAATLRLDDGQAFAENSIVVFESQTPVDDTRTWFENDIFFASTGRLIETGARREPLIYITVPNANVGMYIAVKSHRVFMFVADDINQVDVLNFISSFLQEAE